MPAAGPASARPARLERLELRIERLRTTHRFTWAFHAREIRFERDSGEGFVHGFPETFSFHPGRHDPAELHLQLEDLWSRPALTSPVAAKRDAEEVVRRLCAAAPRYFERILDRLEREAEADGGLAPARVYEDLHLLTRVFARFVEDRELHDTRDLLEAALLLRKLAWRALRALVRLRVRPESRSAWMAGTLDVADPTGDPSDSALQAALGAGSPDVVDRTLLRLADAAFQRWVEEVCLDESVDAFDRADSPFGAREREVREAVALDGREQRIVRASELAIFLRRARDRDCARILGKLERFFLRQYDVHHAAVMIHHAAALERGVDTGTRVLSRHSTRNYLLLLTASALPLLAGGFAYHRAPILFDLAISAQVVVPMATVFWFLLYRFAWKRDLSVFHAQVPRLGAGIVVGYLPVFLIDEVWDLALRAFAPVVVTCVLFALTTLLFLHVEVQRRIRDRDEAFRRARSLYFLAVVQAFLTGLVTTSLLGRFMIMRASSEIAGAPLPFEQVRTLLPPVLGDLPQVVGVEPFLVFPTVVFLMTFLSIFIGTFLQLLWEDLPITEPL